MSPLLDEGKLPPRLLERLLAYTSSAPELIVGAGAGEDAAVARGADLIVLTTDPITFTEERIGAYAVAVNANDVVAMGGRPVYFTTTILLPKGTTEERLESIFADLADACRKAELLWVGGHTEVTPVVTRVVVVGQAVGFLTGRSPLASGGARPGDLLAMSKWAGLEGTTTIARELPAESEAILGSKRHREVLGWLDEPGISIIAEGRALEGMSLSSGHDPTEGGIAAGAHEMALRSGCGMVVWADRVPVREETRLLCERFALDPLRLLSSGVFLFTASPQVAEEACRRLVSRGIGATVIGEVLAHGHAVFWERSGKREPLVFWAQDEIVKLTRRLREAGPSSPRASTR